jgi:hypothetical protein
MIDSEAKEILRDVWHEHTTLWNTGDMEAYWVRARPTDKKTGHPFLHTPGSTLYTTEPDGLWLYLDRKFYADAICVEHCGTIPNLYDKRSRYIPASHSVMVTCPADWLAASIPFKKGIRNRFDFFDASSVSKTPKDDICLPIRFLRVLYALPDAEYDDWVRQHTPTGWEFFCLHNSLASFPSQHMQDFLKTMTAEPHYYTKPYEKH